jgi:hypothetical protein
VLCDLRLALFFFFFLSLLLNVALCSSHHESECGYAFTQGDYFVFNRIFDLLEAVLVHDSDDEDEHKQKCLELMQAFKTFVESRVRSLCSIPCTDCTTHIY